MNTAPKFLFVLTGVATLSLAHPASVQAVPTTYQYTGNPFTVVSGPYTTSMFVSGMVTLAGPLPPNFSGIFTPLAFTFSDGVQTLSSTTPDISSGSFRFATNARGEITFWTVALLTFLYHGITTVYNNGLDAQDAGGTSTDNFAFNFGSPGVWTQANVTPDAGSTLSLMTLTLMALCLVARRLQRAAA